jgi:CubicO group peptidase (beta-lactamase class C family)
MATTGSELSAERANDIEHFLDGWRGRDEIPGLSVAVTDGDGILHAVGLGASDIDSKTPATAETLYPFASVTKVVTAVVVLQLVERGELALDDEIREYVDVWNDVPGDPITVAELLTHTSGMPVQYRGDRTYLFSEDPPVSPMVTREDSRRQIDSLADQRIVDEKRFMYCDDNYTVLGFLVEAVTGRPFADVVETEVFEPLGMENSTIGYGELSEREDAITGYTIEDGAPTVTEFDFDADTDGLGPGSPSGLLASVTEMARLVRCLLNGGELDGASVLDSELVEAMCTQQASAMEHVDGTERVTGFGPRITQLMGERLVEHTGTAPGVGRAYVGFLPEHELGVTLGTNNPDVTPAALGNGVLALAAGETPDEVVPYLSLRRKLQAVAGTYESPQGNMSVTVEPANDAHLEVTLGSTVPAFPTSMAHDDYTFYTIGATGLSDPLTFHETDEGMEMRYHFPHHRLYRTNRVTDGIDSE